MKKFGIYIHWPFCLSKCPYCDFASVPCRAVDEELLWRRYMRDLQNTPHAPITSVFFGGGTPSMMSAGLLEKFLTEIERDFGFSPDVEISLEANPDAITKEKMLDFKKAGVNRLSLGVQALNDTDLKFLGRIHSAQTALARIDEMRQVFDNCSIDLIYAHPNQTLKSWEAELKRVLSFDLPHISLYQLTIEEGTPFDRKGVEPADDETARLLYIKTFEMTEATGVPLYEVSNFARDGFECRHNLLYWQGDDYAGIGPAAHGRLGLLATENPKDVKEWLSNGTMQTKLTEQERFEEKLLMGLRLRKGMSSKGIHSDKLEEAVRRGWLFYNPRDSWMAPTMEGSLMLNQLIVLLV